MAVVDRVDEPAEPMVLFLRRDVVFGANKCIKNAFLTRIEKQEKKKKTHSINPTKNEEEKKVAAVFFF